MTLRNLSPKSTKNGPTHSDLPWKSSVQPRSTGMAPRHWDSTVPITTDITLKMTSTWFNKPVVWRKIRVSSAWLFVTSLTTMCGSYMTTLKLARSSTRTLSTTKSKTCLTKTQVWHRPRKLRLSKLLTNSVKLKWQRTQSRGIIVFTSQSSVRCQTWTKSCNRKLQGSSLLHEDPVPIW